MIEEQITKALECCGETQKCSECPLIGDYSPCSFTLTKSALGLINHQKAEIESLKEAIVSQNLTPIKYKVRKEHDERHIHEVRVGDLVHCTIISGGVNSYIKQVKKIDGNRIYVGTNYLDKGKNFGYEAAEILGVVKEVYDKVFGTRKYVRG